MRSELYPTNDSESWPVQSTRKEGKTATALFPVQLSMTDPNSGFINFYFQPSTTYYWLAVSLLLAFVQFILIRKRKQKLLNQLPDILIICLTGIVGF
ncbi:MAG: hypothetical protein ACK5HT_00395 [Draconibacterium sp.]